MEKYILIQLRKIVEQYKKKPELELQKAEWAACKNEATVTSDGKHVELAANIGTPQDVNGVTRQWWGRCRPI